MNKVFDYLFLVVETTKIDNAPKRSNVFGHNDNYMILDSHFHKNDMK